MEILQEMLDIYPRYNFEIANARLQPRLQWAKELIILWGLP